MDQRKDHYLIPEKQKGHHKDLFYGVKAPEMEDAEDWFVEAKERLLDVNNWRKYCNIFDAEFILTDNHGKQVYRHARKDDYIRVNLKNISDNETHAWIHIEAIEYDDYPDDNRETMAMRLLPSPDPKEQNKEEILRFFYDMPTTTLVIERIGTRLYASYHGRNEEDTIVPLDNEKITLGAWLGVSDVDWGKLISGLVQFEIVT